MNEFQKLGEFINLAQKNRKYPANTAHGKRAALKLFETVLHPDELDSLELIQERMKEIFLSLISKHKEDFSIQSLSTYKGRLLATIADYQKYGHKPQAFAHWEVKVRRHKHKDNNQDSTKDRFISGSSLPIHKHVHKIQISLEDGDICSLDLPSKITKEDASIIIKIIESLTH